MIREALAAVITWKRCWPIPHFECGAARFRLGSERALQQVAKLAESLATDRKPVAFAAQCLRMRLAHQLLAGEEAVECLKYPVI